MQAAAAQQQASMAQQMEQARQQAEEQKRQQAEMLKQMEANKPAPAAQVVQGDTETDIRKQAAQRRGMRRSILAGESNQAPISTGYSTLG
jgi:queuine/archaeosine tRNA-ribosyltransferase